ncbi:MAG TPA: hypothetical protein VI251_15995 [Pseudolabrys sp.]
MIADVRISAASQYDRIVFGWITATTLFDRRLTLSLNRLSIRAAETGPIETLSTAAN